MVTTVVFKFDSIKHIKKNKLGGTEMRNQLNNQSQRKATKTTGLINLFIVIFTIGIFLTSNLIAQEGKVVPATNSSSFNKEFNQAINSCPGGLVLGVYSNNYEYLVGKNHGLVGRFDYEDIPKNYTDAKLKASGVAFILNYRWHFSGEMESFYVGAFIRYRAYSGTGVLESTKFDFTLREQTLGLNIGKRWVWKNGINLNLAFGYGFFLTKNRDADPSNSSIESSLNEFEKTYDFIDPFLGELSIGYAF